MTKKKNKLEDLLGKQIEAQGLRIKEVISEFYPDGVRAEFIEPPKVGEIMMDSIVTQKFSEDEQEQAKCFKIIEDTMKKESTSMDINFFASTVTFQNLYCIDCKACIMFKAAPEDTPIYIQNEFVDKGIVPRFLVDGEKKDAFLVLADCNAQDRIDFMSKNSSFIRLSELQVIISGYDEDALEERCFMVSFLRKEGRCVVERIDSFNRSLLDQLFSPDEPSTGVDSQPESVAGVLEEAGPVTT